MAASFLVVVVLLGLLLLVGVVVAALVLPRAARGDRARPPEVRDGRRGVLRTAGAVAGLAAAWALTGWDTLGRGLLLAAPVAALGVLLGVLAAELAVRPPSGPRRSASLTTRRVTDYLPRVLTPVVAATGASLVSLTAVTTAMGSPDDMGRAGRALAWACSADETSARGPWPGSFYTWPLLLVVAVGVLLALLVLRATVARPPLVAGPDAEASPARAGAADHTLRVRSARAVVAGLGVLFSVPLAGTAAVTAVVVGGTGGCAPGWWTAVGVVAAVLSPAAGVVLLWCVGVVLAGGRTPTTAQAPAVRT